MTAHRMRATKSSMMSLAAVGCLIPALVAGCSSSGSSKTTAVPSDTTAPVTAPSSPTDSNVFKIGVVRISSDNVLNQVQAGLEAQLKTIGAQRNVTFKLDEKDAQNEASNAQIIAQQFVQQKVNLIVGIGTPAVVAANQVTKTIPIIFGGMTDPVGAGVAASLAHPGGNATGTTDFVDPSQNVDVIRKVLPNAKTIGTIINESEANSVSWLKAFQQAASADGLKVIVGPVASSGDVQSATLSLMGRVDAILIGADNTALTGTGAIASIAEKHKVPVFSTDSDATSQGALIGMGVSSTLIGTRTADVVAEVLLDGKNPGDLPVVGQLKISVTVNDSVAKQLDVTVPAEVANMK